MKKKILITNIGNRNLYYKGESLIGRAKKGSEKLSFRTFTEKIWQNYEEEKQYLSLNILDTLFETKAQEIKHVFLFSSDQPTGLRQDQDTLFAGKILAKLIPSLFPDLSVHNLVLQVPITDNDQLLLTYRKEIRILRDTFPNTRLMICDAGGTAQQKSSLKIVCEYLFDREDVEVFYISQGKDYKSTLMSSAPIEYRRIVDAEQILCLMEHGQYAGAAQIFVNAHRQGTDLPVYKLLQFCRYRIERMWMEAQKYCKIDSFPKTLHTQLPALKKYKKLQATGRYEGWVPEVFSKRSYFELCECYAIIERYHQMGAYTDVVLNMFRFIEMYVYYVLEEKLGYRLIKNFVDAQNVLLREAKSRFPEIAQHYGRRKIRGGVPLFILTAAQLTSLKHPQHAYFVKSFKSLISSLNPSFRRDSNVLALDLLRHQIAHRGLGVSEKEFKSIPDVEGLIAAWGHWLQMPEENPYLKFHQLIEDLL